MYSVDTIELLGGVAALLTTAAFVPQVVKSWRTRSTRDVSLAMYAVFAAGLALCLVYGFLLGSRPIIVANTVTLALAFVIIGLKLRGDRT
jgi:MtN3 and saliva related transmembrane protein